MLNRNFRLTEIWLTRSTQNIIDISFSLSAITNQHIAEETLKEKQLVADQLVRQSLGSVKRHIYFLAKAM